MKNKTYVLYNNLDDIFLGFFDLKDFIHRVNVIAKENEDFDISLLHEGECIDYINEYCENLNLFVLEYITKEDIETIIENLRFDSDDNLIYYVVSNYNDVDSDETWDIIVEDLVYQYTSEHPENYIQKERVYPPISLSDDELIEELKRRGYYTDLLLSKHDVEYVLSEDYDEQKLSDENKIKLIQSIDRDNFNQELNELISKMIEDDYSDQLFS